MVSERTSEHFLGIVEWPEGHIGLNPLIPAVHLFKYVWSFIGYQAFKVKCFVRLGLVTKELNVMWPAKR